MSGEALIVPSEVSLELDLETHSSTAPNALKQIPSLYPVYLPYPTQHRILAQVQERLEHACYSSGREKLVDIISKEGWNCSESVELNIWAKTLAANQCRFEQQGIANLGKPLAEVLESVARIRHTAVHRLHVTVVRVEQYLSDAELLTTLLRDDACTRRLSQVRREVSLTVDELKRTKDVLESKLADTLKKLAARRSAQVGTRCDTSGMIGMRHSKPRNSTFIRREHILTSVLGYPALRTGGRIQAERYRAIM